ncbi:MAG: hypothetical protein RBT37_01280 [Dissulfurispiraceae bacterium]|jgi:hypothetical protein|nr:hypothetical protein [Dissulfurispiraceae bacterium]
MQKPDASPKYVVYLFFMLGLVSAIAFRIVIVFQHIEPAWIRPVWYIGVCGYVLFFYYRYRIAKKRKRAIQDFNLIEKLRANACLTEEDRSVVLYLLGSIKRSPEDKNYAVIFILSILAIAADLILYSLE